MSEPETDATTATTELLPRARAAEPEPAPAPVFVDASGRRRKLAHRLTLGLFLTAAGYSLMVIWSLLGGPVSPDSLMPFSAPHPTHSGAKPAETTRPSPTDATAANPAMSFGSGYSTTTAAGAGTSPGPTASPATATASPSASPTGHRPTTAPGKPTSSPTNGHRH